MKTTTKTTHGMGLTIVSFMMATNSCLLNVFAGDLTVDNLTINSNTTAKGTVTLIQRSSASTNLALVVQYTNASPCIQVRAGCSNDSSMAVLQLGKTWSTNLSTWIATPDWAMLGQIQSFGATSSNAMACSSSISFQQRGTSGPTGVGGRILFSTTPDGYTLNPDLKFVVATNFCYFETNSVYVLFRTKMTNGYTPPTYSDGCSLYVTGTNAAQLMYKDGAGNVWDLRQTGVTNHAELVNLSYASSGHTGFQPAGTYLTNGQTGVTLSGAISGTGSGLTGLDAGNLATGTVELGRLSGITSNELAATEREKLDAAQTAAQVNGIVAEVLSTNIAADSAKLGGIAADGFPTLSSNQVWTGVNAFEHEVHLTYGTYLGGASLYTKDGSGYGGGNVYMDGGYLYMSNSSSAYILGSQDAWGQPVVGVGGGNFSLAGRYLYMNGGSGSGGMGIVMDGGYIGMNGGNGYGGGNVYMDGGYLYMSNSSSAYMFGSQDAWGQPVVGVGGGNFSLAGRYLYMNGGSGSGGMGIVMDGGYIGMNGGNGYGGGNVYMDSGHLYMSNSASAYFYGADTGGVHIIKVGNGGLDLEGSSGIVYHPPLGNLSMGVYTNR